MRNRLMMLVLGMLLVTLASTRMVAQSSKNDAEIRTRLERLFASWTDLDPAKAAPFYPKIQTLCSTTWDQRHTMAGQVSSLKPRRPSLTIVH